MGSWREEGDSGRVELSFNIWEDTVGVDKMAEKNKCRRSIEAAMSVISESIEECGGQFVAIDDIGDGMVVWVPKGALEHQPHGDHEGEVTREEMIKACMESSWAKGLSRAMTTTPEAQREVARKVCEGLYD